LLHGAIFESHESPFKERLSGAKVQDVSERTRENAGMSPKIATRLLKELLVRIEFAVFAGVVQGHVGICSFIERIDFAVRIGMGVDMNAGGALIELRKIENLMNGLFALHGSGMSVVHVIKNAGSETAGAAVAIFFLHAEILDAQFANGHSHPAILSAMIVNAASLAHFPANGHDFEEIALENEVPRVMAIGVKKVGLQSGGANLMLLKVAFDIFESELFAMDGGKAANPVIDG
jgi:hypothetical protein